MKIFNQIKSKRLNCISQYSISWYKRSILFNTFSITSITFILFYEFFETISFRILYEFVYLSNLFYEFAYIYSNFYAKSIYHSVRMTIFIFAFIFAFDFLFFSFAFCDHVFENHFMTQNFKTFYNMHLNENVKILKCNWYVQIKKTQKIYHLRKHELQMKNKIKQKTKKLLKQQKKFVWSKNELKNILVDVAKTIRNLTTTSNFTNIFVFDTRKSRNLFNNLLNLLFHLFSNR